MIGITPPFHEVEDDRRKDKIKQHVDQVTPPLQKIEHPILPWMLLSNGKIVKYNISAMKVWKSLIQTTHTIISNNNVYHLLCILTVFCFLTFMLVYLTGGAKSSKFNSFFFKNLLFTMAYRLQSIIRLVFFQEHRLYWVSY